MYRNIVKALLLLVICIIVPSAAEGERMSKLRFRKNGEFRIMQVTDTHYKWGNSGSKAVDELIAEVILREDVDLVVFTGDNVYAEGVRNALDKQLRPFVDNGTPFVVLFGNHDRQFEVDQNLQWDFFRSYPHNMQPDREIGKPYPDFVLPIYASDSENVAQLIYNFDSHAAHPDGKISRYDCLHDDQIKWYKTISREYNRMNGGKPVPSIMFMHIPLPEYEYAWDYNTSRENKWEKGTTVIGKREEKVSCPRVNSGMFDAIKEMGDIRGVFCGHDHDNDFALIWKGVLLAYGRYSGGKTVYNHLGKNGVRIITLHEDSPSIDTYIRLRGGDIINRCSYPADF